MREVLFRFAQDQDGALVTLEFLADDPLSWRDRDLEIALLFEADDIARDPVLGCRELRGEKPPFRSPPLQGQTFLDLREIWKRRRGEGVRVEIRGLGEIPVASWALDFEGNLARGRIHEAAGRLEEALAAYRESSSPSRDTEVQRLLGKLGRKAEGETASQDQATPKESSDLDGESVVLHILRAIAADGKVDEQEMRTLKSLGPVFKVRSDRLKELINQVRDEGTPSGGQAMVPAQVLRDLLRSAARGGRIGPESSRLLQRAAHVLGLSMADVQAILAGS